MEVKKQPMSISHAIESIRKHGFNPIRQNQQYSFGDRAECRKLFEELFLATDKTVKEFKYLPEYENIIQWMMDSKGTGLAMVGTCGRGKTAILTGVIPVLFMMKNKVIRPYQAFDIPDKINEIIRQWVFVIDEVGTENQCNEWGEKYEGFNRITDNAEAKMKMLFFTTNLTAQQMQERYGLRTWDRIRRLCRVVSFEGSSLR